MSRKLSLFIFFASASGNTALMPANNYSCKLNPEFELFDVSDPMFFLAIGLVNYPKRLII
jgi:hypothetical protein